MTLGALRTILSLDQEQTQQQKPQHLMDQLDRRQGISSSPPCLHPPLFDVDISKPQAEPTRRLEMIIINQHHHPTWVVHRPPRSDVFSHLTTRNGWCWKTPLYCKTHLVPGHPVPPPPWAPAPPRVPRPGAAWAPPGPREVHVILRDGMERWDLSMENAHLVHV